MIDYNRVKNAIIRHRKSLLSSNYPPEFLEQVLDLYIRDLPFYYNDRLIYSLSKDPFGNICIESLISSERGEFNILFPALHAYKLSKTLKKKITAMTNKSQNLLNSLRKYGYITTQRDIYQLCIVSEKDLFVGKNNKYTIENPFTRYFIPPLVKLLGKIKITPFWIEIFCQSPKKECIELIGELMPLKGVISVYSETKDFLDFLHIYFKKAGYSSALDHFISYELNKEKLRILYERRKNAKFEVIFNPFRYKFNPLK